MISIHNQIRACARRRPNRAREVFRGLVGKINAPCLSKGSSRRTLAMSLHDLRKPRNRASRREKRVNERRYNGASNKSYDNERASIAISGSRAQSILPSCRLRKDGLLVPLTRTRNRFTVVQRPAACRIGVGERRRAFLVGRLMYQRV